MKAWKKAVIIGAIFAGVITVPWLVTAMSNGELPDNTQTPAPHEFSEMEFSYLQEVTHVSMKRGEVRNDTATNFMLGEYLTEYGISADGYYCAITPQSLAIVRARLGPSSVMVIRQYRVTLDGFVGNSVLDMGNVVIDEAHECLILLQSDGLHAYIVVGFVEA